LLTLTVAPAAQPDVGLMADTVSTPAGVDGLLTLQSGLPTP
jgi:hypothetical protein